MKHSYMRQYWIDRGKLRPVNRDARKDAYFLTPLINLFNQRMMGASGKHSASRDYDCLVWMPCQGQYFEVKEENKIQCDHCGYNRHSCGVSYL